MTKNNSTCVIENKNNINLYCCYWMPKEIYLKKIKNKEKLYSNLEYLHRIDGPAFITHKSKWWYIDNNRIRIFEFD